MMSSVVSSDLKSDTVAVEEVFVCSGEDSDSLIGLFLQVRDQLEQTRTWFVDDPAWVLWVGSMERIQDFQSVEMLKFPQTQKVVIWNVKVSECRRKPFYIFFCKNTKSSVNLLLVSPDSKALKVRKQLWEESDQFGGGAPGLQVEVLQVRSSGRHHLQVFRLKIHTQSQAEEGRWEEVCICCQRMSS